MRQHPRPHRGRPVRLLTQPAPPPPPFLLRVSIYILARTSADLHTRQRKQTTGSTHSSCHHPLASPAGARARARKRKKRGQPPTKARIPPHLPDSLLVEVADHDARDPAWDPELHRVVDARPVVLLLRGGVLRHVPEPNRVVLFRIFAGFGGAWSGDSEQRGLRGVCSFGFLEEPVVGSTVHFVHEAHLEGERSVGERRVERRKTKV